MANQQVTFGKYKGQYVSELPSFYLKWLSIKAYSYTLKRSAQEEYSRRTTFGQHWGDTPARRMS